MNTQRIVLEPNQLPTKWYNIASDMNGTLAAPLHPVTKEPLKKEDLSAIFPDELIEQELSEERYIDIPEEVQDIYRITRPTPLIRATRLEEYLDTPAKIFFKHEGTNPAGSHKTNTAIPQAYYNKKAGITKLVTETGAGQWGSALSFACKQFDMQCQVFMVKVSYDHKPYRKTFIQLYDGDVVASPSTLTNCGKAILAQDPDSPGSLGIAISEAVEIAAQNPDINYTLGSVLNHVMLHQTVIGEEAMTQMEIAGEYPDVVIGCVGGGSNFAGLSFSFLRDKLSGKKKDLEVIGIEPASCPTLTKGKFEYDYGDQAGLTPLIKMFTLGANFIPPKIHSGGLRYHGASPIVSELLKQGMISAESYNQKEIFEAAKIFAQTEGIIPAPESSHAIKSAVTHALKCKESGEEKTILFNLSGHGLLDLGSYDSFLAGKL